MKITRADVIEEVVEKVGIDKTKAGKALNTILDKIMQTVADGGEVQFVGFGTFRPITRKERIGHNPATGEKLTIPATKTVTLRVSKDFKKLLNE